MKIAFFGSSLVSAYWNGAATYYRGLIRALAERGHEVTFFEPDAYERQAHRDIPDPDWAKVVVYEATELGVRRALGQARGAELVIKCSGVGVFDDLLEREVLRLASDTRRIGFCDVDAPATLEKALNDERDPFRALIPAYDFVFTYGGGEPVRSRYLALGARDCVPIYNALDPRTHHEASPDPAFSASLGFLGNRLPDREARVDEFFFRPACELSTAAFLLGGSGWDDKPRTQNVRYVGHVGTAEHNAFNSSPLAVLNISRDSMASYGFSPATRVFEAAGAGACIITDAWQGVELFLEPGSEILVARDGKEVAALVAMLTLERAREIGQRAKSRVLREHTYARRAQQLEELLLSVRGRDGAGPRVVGNGLLARTNDEAPTFYEQILTRYQRLLPFVQQPDPVVRRVLARHRSLYASSKPLVLADYAHALDTWRWTLRLDLGASRALQLAALFHDIERLVSEPERRVEHLAPDYQAFKRAHARSGAKLSAEILAECGLSGELVERVQQLIERHEAPGEDTDLAALNDADALSFFSLNSWGFVEYFGLVHARAKVLYTLARMRPAARRYLGRFRYHPRMRALLREQLDDRANIVSSFEPARQTEGNR